MLNRTLTAHYVRRAFSWACTALALFAVLVLFLLMTSYLAMETQ